MKKITYFIYARKSSETEDRQVQSIDDQLDVLKKLAAERQLEIVEIFTEAKSAKAPGRPLFNEMINRLQKGEASGIICWKLDRLFRNPIDFGQISWNLQKGIINHILCSDRSYYPDDNVLLMSVEQGMANQFIRDLSKNTQRGLLRKAERGWYPALPPIGYLHNPNKKKGDKEILTDPVNFPLVRKMYDLMLTGNYSATQVLETATNEWGLRNRFGNKVCRNSIYYIFNNVFYTGEYEYPIGSGNFYKGLHQPMITKEEFNLIQRTLNRTSQGRFMTKEMTYRGMIKCGECGSMITGEEKSKKQKNGNVHEYIYYQCTKRKVTLTPCSQKTIEIKPLEEQMSNALGQIELGKEFAEWAIKTIKSGVELDGENINSIRANQKRELSIIERKLDSLINLKINEGITEIEYDKKRTELIQDKKNLELALNKLPDLDRANKQTIDFINFSHDLKEKFDSGTHEDRKKIMSIIGANLYLTNRKLEIQLEKPFSFIANGIVNDEGFLGKTGRCEPMQPYIKKGTYSDFTAISPYPLRG